MRHQLRGRLRRPLFLRSRRPRTPWVRLGPWSCRGDVDHEERPLRRGKHGIGRSPRARQGDKIVFVPERGLKAGAGKDKPIA
jgi:hypothetical protein